jgi:hypothetical protein
MPAIVQAGALSLLTLGSRLVARGERTLPPIGEPSLFTSVLRLPGVWSGESAVHVGHYVYPASSVHVTVTSLDGATNELDDAIVALGQRRLPAPTLRITGFGRSPGTVFLRCIHDHALAELRASVCTAFGILPPRRPTAALFRRLSYANVVRFAGTPPRGRATFERTTITCTEMEIVRTDRCLSADGTIVLARVALSTGAG